MTRLRPALLKTLATAIAALWVSAAAAQELVV